jgi:hypothetical protein
MENFVKDATFFKNQGAASTLDFVNQISLDKRYILTGAPGTGKSTIWWVGICKRSAEHPEETFVCIWTQKGSFRGLLVVQGGEIIEGAMSEDKSLNVVQLVDTLQSKKYRNAYFIVDGVNNDHSQTITNVRGNWLLISSVGLRFTGDSIAGNIPQRHLMQSWLKEEYAEAVKIEEIVSRIPLTADCKQLGIREQNITVWVQEKYHFCGGSARFMLEFSLEEALEIMDSSLGSVSDPSALLDNADAVSGKGSISTLRQCIGGVFFILSDYVMEQLLDQKKITPDFIAAAKHYARDNGSLMGWIHELELKYMLSHNHRNNVYTMELQAFSPKAVIQTVQFNVLQVEHFHKIEELSASLYDTSVILFPRKTNFGCLDAALVRLDGESCVLMTFQATKADSHNFKPKDLILVIQALARNANVDIPSNFVVWHVFVLQTQAQYRKFKFNESGFITASTNTNESMNKSTKAKSQKKSLKTKSQGSARTDAQSNKDIAYRFIASNDNGNNGPEDLKVKTVFFKTWLGGLQITCNSAKQET